MYVEPASSEQAHTHTHKINYTESYSEINSQDQNALGGNCYLNIVILRFLSELATQLLQRFLHQDHTRTRYHLCFILLNLQSHVSAHAQ